MSGLVELFLCESLFFNLLFFENSCFKLSILLAKFIIDCCSYLANCFDIKVSAALNWSEFMFIILLMDGNKDSFLLLGVLRSFDYLTEITWDVAWFLFLEERNCCLSWSKFLSWVITLELLELSMLMKWALRSERSFLSVENLVISSWLGSFERWFCWLFLWLRSENWFVL